MNVQSFLYYLANLFKVEEDQKQLSEDRVKFKFSQEDSSLFGKIYTPIIDVSFYSKKYQNNIQVAMILDTGADYSVLPHFMAVELGIDLQKEAKLLHLQGVGGTEKVYFVEKVPVKIAHFSREIPIGFMENDLVPPLMGRHGFIETFLICLNKQKEIEFS